MKETVLIYNINEKKAKEIKRVSILLGVRVRNVTEDMYEEKLGVIAGAIKADKLTNEKTVTELENVEMKEEMLVMCGFSNEKVDRFLMEMRKKNVGKIGLKAVLTPYNLLWNSYKLYEELMKEHKIMHRE